MDFSVRTHQPWPFRTGQWDFGNLNRNGAIPRDINALTDFDDARLVRSGQARQLGFRPRQSLIQGLLAVELRFALLFQGFDARLCLRHLRIALGGMLIK